MRMFWRGGAQSGPNALHKSTTSQCTWVLAHQVAPQSAQLWAAVQEGNNALDLSRSDGILVMRSPQTGGGSSGGGPRQCSYITKVAVAADATGAGAVVVANGVDDQSIVMTIPTSDTAVECAPRIRIHRCLTSVSAHSLLSHTRHGPGLTHSFYAALLLLDLHQHSCVLVCNDDDDVDD